MNFAGKIFIAMTMGLMMMPLHAEKTRVACIGNSITYGYGLEDPAANSYPTQLQKLLGDEYEVGRFATSGSTLLNHGHRPYMQQNVFGQALEFTPDIAVIHLGINDTDPRNWPNYNDEFVGDYLALIDSLRLSNPYVRIIIANLTPLKATHPRFKSGTRDWRLQIRDQVANVAKIANAELIDFNPPLRDRQNLLYDGIHSNQEGYGLLAQSAYSAITGDYGGLQLPPVWSDGMVLQRDQPFTITGTANSSTPVTVEIDGRRHTATANNQGEWSVSLPPLVVGPSYDMTVSTPDQSITIKEIVAGELWIASGQSNMAFMVSQADDAQQVIQSSSDPLLRFYDMKPRAETNKVEWPDSILDALDQLDYYLPAKWQEASPQTVGTWSAVAYHFAKELRDSLDVPIGVIVNAIGGAPTEAWIDINTLEMEMPEILVDWRNNDYVQKWAQGRANLNTQSRGAQGRHPYEPSYLFATGIRPLGQLPISGVLWYQGESNAHNIEIHEKLFPMFVDSWRRWFGDPQLPVCFAQLSSTDRPSWPQFRDSQRRLADSMHDVYMAVTSDVGDSLDVHPHDKHTVGHRLALTALNNIYEQTQLETSGPMPIQVTAIPGALILTMDHADGMKLDDGSPANSFEIAEIEGAYVPAQTEIKGRTIVLTNPQMKKPVYVRYGWQPYTRARLVNSSDLPASTFKAKAVNASDYQTEDGMEHGVSACYFGILDGKMLRAGGCNFPTDPLGPASQKKFYQGIYAASPDDIQWERIGTLPSPMAYGATATTDTSLILIGGDTPSKAIDNVYELSIDADGIVSVKELPSLPYPMDNMNATTIGRKIYVAGGNANSTPSRGLLMLDLDKANKGWQQLKEMPGNPRVQPVVAAAKNAKGEDCIYLWGGFAGRHDNNEPTLNTDGLCYNTKNGQWSTLAAPTAPDGEEISLGGGVATTLAEGTIAATGGVNKDIFIEALRNQAPDYLMHPVTWYKFNTYVVGFDPKTDTWKVLAEDAGAARAGGAIYPGDNAIYVYGGELKPRIRTSETSKIAF